MENIPVILLFAITLAANLTGGLFRAYYSKNISSSVAGYHLFNAAVVHLTIIYRNIKVIIVGSDALVAPCA